MEGCRQRWWTGWAELVHSSTVEVDTLRQADRTAAGIHRNGRLANANDPILLGTGRTCRACTFPQNGGIKTGPNPPQRWVSASGGFPMITICPSRLWGDPPGGKGAFGGVAVPIGFAVERRPGALAGAESRQTRIEKSTLTNSGTNKRPEGILREGRSWKDSERRIVQDRRRPANGSQAEQREGWRGKEKRREKSKKKHPKRPISKGAAFIKGRYCRGERSRGAFFFSRGKLEREWTG